MANWSRIENQPLLKTIFRRPPIISFKRDEAAAPPPYTEQQMGGSPSGSQTQPVYPAQLHFPASEGYLGQATGHYPGQQPSYTAPTHPFAASQPTYPLQTLQPAPVHHTSTVIMPATQTVILPSAPPRPSTWLGLSIFTFLFCAWPIGLAAMIFSCMVDSSYNGGDYEGARRNSKIAMWLNIIALLSGVGVVTFIVIRFAILVNSAVN
ncbi:unnamed protein product [Porites evermanni]|uniref:Tumor suppressor candidate 5 n=1 Tax=Porites evermanni TaxID=104178 RepID=A0ABN8SM49_9CNID|nr:unnamed protein product [Porites evermanni]